MNEYISNFMCVADELSEEFCEKVLEDANHVCETMQELVTSLQIKIKSENILIRSNAILFAGALLGGITRSLKEFNNKFEKGENFDFFLELFSDYVTDKRIEPDKASKKSNLH